MLTLAKIHRVLRQAGYPRSTYSLSRMIRGAGQVTSGYSINRLPYQQIAITHYNGTASPLHGEQATREQQQYLERYQVALRAAGIDSTLTATPHLALLVALHQPQEAQ